MTPRSLAAASTLAALAAGATWAVWPSKPHVPQPATTHETMRECPSDGGTGPCQMREHVCRWTDSPDAGGEITDCSPLVLSVPIPVAAGAAIQHPVTHAAQVPAATRVPGLHRLHGASMGCTCAAWGSTDCQWQPPRETARPCPPATTMQAGECKGAGCLPTFCFETFTREQCGGPGCEMTPACRAPVAAEVSKP